MYEYMLDFTLHEKDYMTEFIDTKLYDGIPSNEHVSLYEFETINENTSKDHSLIKQRGAEIVEYIKSDLGDGDDIKGYLESVTTGMTQVNIKNKFIEKNYLDNRQINNLKKKLYYTQQVIKNGMNYFNAKIYDIEKQVLDLQAHGFNKAQPQIRHRIEFKFVDYANANAEKLNGVELIVKDSTSSEIGKAIVMDVNNLNEWKITNLLIVLDENKKPNKGDILTIQVNGGVKIEVTNVSLEYAEINEIKTAVIEYAKYSGYLHYLSMLLNQLNSIFKNIEAAGNLVQNDGHVKGLQIIKFEDYSSKIDNDLNTKFKESFAPQGDDYTVGKCFLRVPIGYDEIFKNNITIIKPELETKIIGNESKYLMKPMLDLIVSGSLKPKYLPEAALRIAPPLFDYDGKLKTDNESNTTNEFSQVLKGGGYLKKKNKSRKNIKKVIHKKLKTKYSRK